MDERIFYDGLLRLRTDYPSTCMLSGRSSTEGRNGATDKENCDCHGFGAQGYRHMIYYNFGHCWKSVLKMKINVFILMHSRTRIKTENDLSIKCIIKKKE